MSLARHHRKWLGMGIAGAVMAGTIIPVAAAMPALAANGTAVITSGQMSVEVSTAFPQALKYTLGTKTMTGATTVATKMRINGVDQAVNVTSSVAGDAKSINYDITVPGMTGVSMKARLAVEANVLTFNITEIKEDGDARVNRIQIMDQDLVTVSSAQAGASIAAAVVSADRATSGDTITTINADTAVDSVAKTSMVAIANTAELAAGFESNSLYDGAWSTEDNGLASSDRGRFWRQVKDDGANKKVGISSGAWLYRAKDSTETEPLPEAKVIITGDANADGTVNWQDGAIASRDIQYKPKGWEDVKNRVVQNIPFNFASQATNPFLRTLDDVKHIAQATDGLGQYSLLKGFTSEGHDSANSDFSGNWNERAGGIKDMNALLEQAKAYGATFTVHMNNTEAYPEAKSFSDAFIKQPPAKGWNWLEQSYYIDQRRDVLSGDQNARIKGLADATNDNLTANYIDVYYESGWVGERLQRNIMDNGFAVSTEFAVAMPRNNTWSHWAVDEKYGGSTMKGWNSEILRFAQNSQRDVWNPDPRLGTAHIVEWQGWTGQNDYNAFLKNVWDNNVPVKFLQQQEIKTWTPAAITLGNNLSVTGTSLENRVITQDGVKVLEGHNYLLPWAGEVAGFGDNAKPAGAQTKLYNYSLSGGTQNWKLTPAFASQSSLKLYKLGDQGRQFVADVPVVDGGITLTPEANTAYVLVPTADLVTVPSSANTSWGADTGVKDPGFNSGNLNDWNVTGDVTLSLSAKGLTSAKLGAGAASISQELAPLNKGTYSVSAWVEIDPAANSTETYPRGKRETTLSATVSGSPAVSNTTNSSALFNTVAADQKNRTFTQRVRVLIDVLKDGDKPTVTFSAADGTTAVLVDDFRVVKTQHVAASDVIDSNPSGVVLAEDFENVDQGWGPFVKGDAGNVTDPRTHLAPIHAPFTQKGWNKKVMDDVLNGSFSLHAHEENSGLVYRTTPSTVKFTPGHDYEISFNYQSTKANEYAWVGGYDGVGGAVQTQTTPFPEMHETTRWTQNFTASACGDSYVGLLRTGSSAADLSLDNLLIRDLGVSTSTPACAQLSLGQTGPIIEQGQDNEFTTTLTSNEPADVKDVAISLVLPEGWTATAKTPATAATLAPGAKFVTKWAVHAPASADGSYNVTAKSVYTTTVDPIGPRQAESTRGVYTMPHPPTADTFASDMQWIGEPTNGWGPVEKDLANGEQGAKDGNELTLDGKIYNKGLGVHAISNIKYYVGGQCSVFNAVIGVDDYQGNKGSVVFSVVGDGVELYNSGVVTGADKAKVISVPLNGAKYVELKVGDNGNNGNDWADWADAKFTCSDVSPALVLAPVVNPAGPLEQGQSFTVTVGELKAGTEATFSLGTTELGKATASAAGVATFTTKVAADAALGGATINVAGTDKNGKAATGSTNISVVGAPPAAPTKDVFASDLDFVGTPVNEWGPVERDQNNGEDAKGDGAPITMDGTVYQKGLGVHADSSVRFYLGGQCTTFTATVGIDDAKLPKAHRGHVVFTVVGDGKTLATSPELTVDDAGYALTADVTGVRYVDLNVAKIIVAGKNGDEWADWADAKFSCGETAPALVLAPVVEGGNAVTQGSTHKVTVADLKAGSEATLSFTSGSPATTVDLTATADANGVATFSLAVPADATVGAAVLTATGTDKNGKAATGATNIAITAKTVDPTDPPTDQPTDEPTDNPTDQPTDGATGEPTDEPTDGSTGEPTDEATPTAPGPRPSSTEDTTPTSPGATAPGGNGDELPHTGANGVLPIAALALLALMGGAATLLVRRRRTHG